MKSYPGYVELVRASGRSFRDTIIIVSDINSLGPPMWQPGGTLYHLKAHVTTQLSCQHCHPQWYSIAFDQTDDDSSGRIIS